MLYVRNVLGPWNTWHPIMMTPPPPPLIVGRWRRAQDNLYQVYNKNILLLSFGSLLELAYSASGGWWAFVSLTSPEKSIKHDQQKTSSGIWIAQKVPKQIWSVWSPHCGHGLPDLSSKSVWTGIVNFLVSLDYWVCPSISSLSSAGQKSAK